jgi:hypothetical protein
MEPLMPNKLTGEDLHRLNLEDTVLHECVMLACRAMAKLHQFSLVPPDHKQPDALRVYWYVFAPDEDLDAISREQTSTRQTAWSETPFPSLPGRLTYRRKSQEMVIRLNHLKGFIGHVPDARMAMPAAALFGHLRGNA